MMALSVKIETKSDDKTEKSLFAYPLSALT